MRIGVFIGMALLTAGLAGCRGPVRTPWDNLRETEQENTELSLQVQSLQKENQELRQQVDTLSGMDKEVRLGELDTLASIKLHNRTGFYDKDNNSTPETLAVYLQTIDAQQDQVKIPGRCTIQLWNLNDSAAETKIAEWTIAPADLQTLWGGNIFAQYYRIALPLTGTPPAGDDLTVRAVFTDLLTGKVLTDQIVIKK